MQNYISKIRQKIGNEKLIYPGARILIENANGEILFVEKTKTGELCLPAGGLEEGETIEECIKREVKEETGLDILALEIIGLSTNPINETVQYTNGDVIQYFTVDFYSNQWQGNLKVTDVDEIKSVSFKNKSYLTQLPKNESLITVSLDYFQKNGKVCLR